MAVHVIDEANRCLQCKKPMCQQGCPIHTPIPTIMSGSVRATVSWEERDSRSM